MTRLLAVLATLFLLAGGASAAPPDPAALHDLAPTGALRAAINYGNPVLAQRLPADGAPHGVSADLARALGRSLGMPVVFVFYDEAGATAAGAKTNAWDVAFLAVDPVRARDIAFTPPYVEIEGAYLTEAGSPLRAVEDVDRAGIKIAVAQGSAYDLYLTRAVRHAELVRLPDTAAAIDAFATRHLDALAGVRQPLEALAAAHPGWTVMPGRFMRIDQAMAMPTGRPAGLRALSAFVEEMKASGFVAKALAASGQTSATVAPAQGR
jgi:polar amino acid transport system substrate-binding protein